MGSGDISTITETTTLESTKIAERMDREHIDMQKGQSMLENGKTASITAKALNTLLTDRYPGREFGQTISMLEKDNCES